jgi:hypothetical protein
MRMLGWIDRDDREPASFPGIVVLADGRRLPVTITNVSSGGREVECEDPLPIGAKVHLNWAMTK